MRRERRQAGPSQRFKVWNMKICFRSTCFPENGRPRVCSLAGLWEFKYEMPLSLSRRGDPQRCSCTHSFLAPCSMGETQPSRQSHCLDPSTGSTAHVHSRLQPPAPASFPSAPETARHPRPKMSLTLTPAPRTTSSFSLLSFRKERTQPCTPAAATALPPTCFSSSFTFRCDVKHTKQIYINKCQPIPSHGPNQLL